MPLFEFSCDKCGQEFEELVYDEKAPQCPNCGANETHKLVSLCARISKDGGATPFPIPSTGRGGCGSCSGGNCGSCGR